MNRHTKPFSKVIWILTIVVPVCAAVLTWPWMGVSTTAQVCVTGSGGGVVSTVGFIVIALVPSVVIGWWARRTQTRFSDAVSAMVLSVLLALPLMFFSASWWWSNHHCYT
jgi:hypothetical protein